VNVHTHALVVDGVFADDGSGHLQFHPAAPPTEEEMDQVLATIAQRVQRLLERRGASGDGQRQDPFLAATPVLAGLTAASIDGRTATGPRPGAQVRRCGGWTEPEPLPAVRRPCHAAGYGFDLDAGVIVGARDRARLERVCRYALRPPVAHDRIQWTAEGDVMLTLRHRWSDGTTHLRFHPLELLERLASLMPRPRINLILYYGVLAAHAGWRPRLPAVTEGDPSPPPVTVPLDTSAATPATQDTPAGANSLWAQLMQRSFGFDVLACPRCPGRLRLLAVIEDRTAVRRILTHLGLPTEVPRPRPPRAPPRRVRSFPPDDPLFEIA
jgi:hypothetical protein